MTIPPDTKRWTWILERPCPECGLDVRAVDGREVGSIVRAMVGTWQEALAAGDARVRPAQDRWSVLEYACHVRDVFRLFGERLALVLGDDVPTFPDWDQDAAAVADRYHEQDPARVAGELTAAAASVAERFDAVTPEQWARRGIRSDGFVFTAESLARYFVHDPVHHLHDIGAR